MFAPGLVGIGVVSNLARVMLAIGRLKVAALAVGGSWVLVIAAQLAIAPFVPSRLVVPTLALGTAIGQTVAAVPLVIVTRRIRGKAAVQGIGRAVLAGVGAAVAGAAVGAAVSIAIPAGHKLLYAAVAILAAVCAAIAFTAVAFVLNRGDMVAAFARLRHMAARWTPRWSPGSAELAARTPSAGGGAAADGPEVTSTAVDDAAVDGTGGDAMTDAHREPAMHTEDGEVTYRSRAMSTLAELGYPVEISQPDPGYALAQIKKGRRIAVVFRHDSRPLTFSVVTEVLASARPSGIPTLLVANQPVTLAAADLAADAGSFEAVHWTGEYDNEELIRRLTSLATARHRR
jgi:hypothetical protein